MEQFHFHLVGFFLTPHTMQWLEEVTRRSSGQRPGKQKGNAGKGDDFVQAVKEDAEAGKFSFLSYEALSA